MASESDGGWTVCTLKEHLTAMHNAESKRVNERLDAQDRAREALDTRHNDRFIAQEKAGTSATEAVKDAAREVAISIKDRFDKANEFRGQLDDQASKLMSKAEASAELSKVNEKVEKLEQHLAEIDKRTFAEATRVAGLSTGSKDSWGYLVGAVGVIATIVTLAMMLLRR